MYRILILSVICLLGWATASIAAPMTLTLAWDMPEEQDLSKIAYYRIYACESPIVAGGESKDNPREDAVTCANSNHVLARQDAVNQSDEMVIEASKEEGMMYFRVSAFGRNGLESNLSNEVKHEYKRELPGTPKVISITIK